ncbi:MAG: ABC transporter permease [Bacteroidetes bacterium]|nr:MAG: ABC transporter permease [Bacteroidota bacterium]
MFKNFFKVAFRNFWGSKGFYAINIIGLAIGMASAIIILLWIQNEVSYDQFHEKKARIYEAWNRAIVDGKLMSWNTTPKILARTVEKDLPEVEQATRVNWNNVFLFIIGDKRLMIRGNHVDSNFLQMFSFPMVKGDPKTALKETYSIVITKKLATKLFGKEDAMGKVINIRNKDNFRVTGILKDIPNNTRFDFECLLPWSYLRKLGPDDDNWENNSTRTYVLLKPNVNLAAVEPKMRVLKQKYDDEAKKDNWQMFLYPISRWRLYSNFQNGFETGGGRITFVRLFGIIAAFILLIACINFMNLSTARSEKRAKEVGIRKVVGAQRFSLISQFIGESILLSFLAGMIAIILVQFSLPAFNQLTEKSLYIPFANPLFWLAAIAFVIVTGFLAGSYPAFFLSSFQPVKVLKGTFKKANALVTPRKVLVVLQFTFAILLIICTIIVKQQIEYAKDRQSGYDRNSLIYIYLSDDLDKNYPLVRNDLLQSAIATSVTKTSAPLTESWSDGWGQEWEGKDPNDKTDFRRYNEDGDLGKTAGLKFIAGRDIDIHKYPTDSLAIILNESALKVMKFTNPVGQLVKDNGQQWHVVGVVKDFILESPYDPIKPMIIYGPKSWFNIIQIKLNDKNATGQNLKAIEAIIKKYDPIYLFEYKFVDQDYATKFEDEKRTGILAGLFAGLTIFISCLGLFGLATYMAEARIKEIGVRKVLGASVTNITALLSKDFVKLVIISILIASPIAWFAMHKWLESYSYRINISLLVFVASGLLAIGISLMTVSYQAIKAAIANPAKSLRSE